MLLGVTTTSPRRQPPGNVAPAFGFSTRVSASSATIVLAGKLRDLVDALAPPGERPLLDAR